MLEYYKDIFNTLNILIYKTNYLLFCINLFSTFIPNNHSTHVIITFIHLHKANWQMLYLLMGSKDRLRTCPQNTERVQITS